LSWHTLFLILILILAIFLRFYHLDKQIWWMSGDDARDMLVVRHIVEYGETINRGPLALGGFGWLKNSPVYYYFVAFLWFLTNSAKGLMYLWAGLFTLPILLAYSIVKKIHQKNSALLAALIFAINPYMINTAKNLTQVHLSVIFSILFIYFLINYLSNKKKKLLNLLGMIGTTFLAFHFHYNIILVFPSLFFLILISYRQLNTGQKKLLSKNSILPILLALILFASWLFLTYTVKLFDQFTFFKINNSLNDKTLSTTILHFYDSSKLVFKLIWGESLASIMIFPTLLLLLFLILKKNRLSNLLLKKSINYFLLILSSIFLIFLYQGSVEDTYFLFLLPIVLILLSLSLILLLDQTKYLAWPIIVAIILLMFRSSINYNFGNFYPLPVYEKKRLLAEIIANDYLSLYPSRKISEEPKILLNWDSQVFNFMNDSWGNPGIWFHLEDIFQQQLVKLVNYGPNYQSTIEKPELIYAVCHHDNDYTKISNCLNNLVKKYPVHLSDIHNLYEDVEVALLRAKIGMSSNTILLNTPNY
jgi:hypothetical protein